MQGKMKQAIVADVKKLAIREVDIPQIAPHEVLVKVEYVGICGSDLHGYERAGTPRGRATFPFVLGHESGGTVIEVGADVADLKPGDRVAMEPGKTCGQCEFCREGKYNLCPDVRFFASGKTDGTFQEYVAHEAALCFKLPDNMSTLEGALIEPLAVGFHAAMQGGAQVGQRAMVFGVGCIGLVSLLALKAMGVTEIYAVDLLENRAQKAKELGATQVINGSKEDVIAKAKEYFGDRPWCDIIIDTSGEDIAIAQSLELLKKGGTLVMVGYNTNHMLNLNTTTLINKEITVKTVFRYRHIYPMAIKAVAEGGLPIADVVTDYFELDDIQRALDESLENKAAIVKGVIKVAKDLD